MAASRASVLRRLALTTALGTGLAAGTSAGAVMPTRGDIASVVLPDRTTVVSTTGTTPPNALSHGSQAISVDSSVANQTTINVPNGRSVINWNAFNVTSGTTYFKSTDETQASAVLNRVIGSGKTTIDAPIIAPSTMQLFVLNSNGILFGPNANVTAGSLIASTRNMLDSNFQAGTLHFRDQLTDSGTAPTAGASTAGIDIQQGARLAATGVLVDPTTHVAAADPATGGLYLIGAYERATDVPTGTAKTVSATGDVAIIAANDVEITPTIGSPLSIRIDKGTAVSGAFQVNAVVNGESVTLAVASQNGFINTLVAAGSLEATNAVAGGGGVVLLADSSAGSVVVPSGGGADLVNSTATIASKAGATIAAADAVTLGGTVNANGVTIAAGGLVASSAAITSNAAVSITAGGTATLTGNVNAGGDYDVAARAITLGASSQSAGGKIDFVASNGDIANDASGAVTLTSNSGNAALLSGLTDAIFLDASGAVSLGTTSLVANRSYVGVSAGAALTNGITLGGVSALAIFQDQGLRVLPALSPFDLVFATGTSLGAINLPTANIKVTSGDLSVASITTTGGSATLSAPAGTAKVLGAVASASDYTVSGRSVQLGTAGTSATTPVVQQAAGIVSISANGGSITSTGALTLASATPSSLAPPLPVLTGNTLTLATTGGTSSIDVRSATLDGGTIAAGVGSAPVRISAPDGTSLQLGAIQASMLQGANGGTSFANGIDRTAAFSVGDVSVGNALILHAGSATLGTGALTGLSIDLAGGAITADSLRATAGDVQVAGSSLVVGRAGVTGTISAAGSVGINTGQGVVTADGITASAGGITVTSEDLTVTGALAATGTSLQPGTIQLTSGGTIKAGSVTATGGTIDLEGSAIAISGAVTATAGSGATGDVTLAADTTLGAGAVAADGALTINGTAAATVASLTAGSAINVGQGATSPASLTVTGTTQAGGTVVAVNSGGALAITTGGRQDYTATVRSGTVTDTAASAATLTATDGAITLASAVVGAGAVDIAGTSIGAADVQSVLGGVTLSGSGGASAGTLSAGTFVSVAATGGTATIRGGVTAATDYGVTARSVSLAPGGTSTTQSANGGVTIDATAGSVTGGAGLTLAAAGANSAQSLLVYGATGVTFATGSLLTSAGGTMTVGVGAGSGQAITLGAVTAARLTGADATPSLAGTLAASGPITLNGAIDVSQTLVIGSTGGAITANAITVHGAGNRLALSTLGGGTDIVLHGALRSDGDLTLRAAGAITGDRPAATVVAGGSANVTADDTVTLASLSGTGARVRGSGITIDRATATSNLLDIGAGDGGITLTQAIGAGGIRLAAIGPALIDQATTTGTEADIVLSGASLVRGIAPGTAANFAATGQLRLTAAGDMLLGTASGDAGVALNGGTIETSTLQSANGDATVTANASATIRGLVDVAGKYAASAGMVTLGGAQSAGGAVTITGTTSVAGDTGLVLTSNRNGTGSAALTLATTAPGATISFGGTTLNGGPGQQSDVQILAAAQTDALVLGTINARGLLGAITGGVPVAPTAGISRAGALTTGDITLSGALILATDGTLTTGALRGGSVTLTAAGTASGAPIPSIQASDGAVTLTASGGTFELGGPVTAAAGGIQFAGAGDFATASAVTATGGAIGFTGSGAFTSTAALTATTAASGVGAITVERGGAFQAASLAADDAITAGGVTAPASFTVTGTTTAGGAVAIATRGDQTFGDMVTAGGPATLDAGGAITLTSLSAPGRVSIAAASLDADTIASTGDAVALTTTGAITVATLTGTGVTADGGSIAIANQADAGSGPLALTAETGALSLRTGTGDAITLSAAGAASIGEATAAADLTITHAASLAGYPGFAAHFAIGRVRTAAAASPRTTLIAAGSISAQVDGAALIATAQAGLDTSITAGSIDVTTATAGAGQLTLDATTGGLMLATGTGATGATLASFGPSAIGAATASGAAADLSLTASTLAGLTPGSRATLSAGRDILASVTGAMVAGPVTAGRFAQLTAGSLDLSTLTATTAALTATAGDLTIAGLTATTATLLARSGEAQITSLDAADATVAAGVIAIATAQGGDLTATSLAGPLQIGNLSIGGTATLTAATDATIGSAEAGAIALTAGGIVTIPTVSTTGATSLSGATVAVGTISGGTVALAASSGALQASSVTGAGGVSLTKTGSTGGISVATAVTAASGPISIASSTGIAVPTLTAGGGLTLTSGGDTSIGTADAASLALTAGGNASIATLALSGGGTIAAGGALLLPGAITVGALAATGGSVTLGTAGTTIEQQATGALAFTATAGQVQGLAGLTLLADSGGTGSGDLSLAATQGISFAAGTALRGGVNESAAVRIAPGAGASLELDTLDARTLTSLDPASTGYASDGSVRIATLTVRDDTAITLTGVGSALTIGNGRALGGSLALATGGALTATTLQALTALSASGGTATIGTATAQTVTLAATGGTLGITDAAATSDTSLVAAGDLRVGSATAGGRLFARAGGDLTGGATAGGFAPAVLAGTGRVDVGTTETGGAGGAILASSITSAGSIAVAGRAIDVGTVTGGAGVALTARANGNATAAFLRVGQVTAATGATLAAGQGSDPLSATNGAVLVDSVRASGGPVTVQAASVISARDGTGATLSAGGAAGDVGVTAGTQATIATLAAGRSADVTVADGPIAIAAASAGGALALQATSGGITLGQATVGSASLRTLGPPAAISAGPLTVTGPLAIAATGDITLPAPVTASAIAITGGGALMVADASAGTSASFTAAGDVSVERVAIGGAYQVSGGSITLGDPAGTAAVQQAGGAVTLTAASGAITGRAGLALTAGSGPVTLTATGAGGTIAFDPTSSIVATAGAVTMQTAGLAALGTVRAPAGSVTVTANDLQLGNGISAPAITLINGTPSNLVVLGDAPADSANAAAFAAGTGPSFGLSVAELGRLSAAQTVIDAGSGAVRLGDVALTTAAGSQLFQIRTTGRMDVLGRFTAVGSPVGRMIVLGGDATDAAQASLLRVVSTAAGGGRLLVDKATLDLRADRIAVGLDQGFEAALGLSPGGTPASAQDVAGRYVAQPASSLYNSVIGNPLGLYSDRVLVSADRLIVRYGAFALFQNTGLAGTSTGVVLAGDGGGATLDLQPAAGANSFALFGTINGISGTAAALLGGDVIQIGGDTSRANSRANGCLIGAGGGGCLASNLVQPTLNLFDVSRAVVFRTAEDLTLPFEPLVSSSNEALFSDIAAIAQSGDEAACGDANTPCPPPAGGTGR